MTKICQNCNYVVPSREDEQEPTGATENCPQCGGISTVLGETEALEEAKEESEGE